MTGEQLTAMLAERVMGWRAGPDRYLLDGRCWLPRWRFRPLESLEDAFRLLSKTASSYTLTATCDGRFAARVCVGSGTGKALGKLRPATITVATARAIGIDVPDELLEERKR
jgi:hypothetical protein